MAMDMADLAACVGIAVRKLRYVFDHRVLPRLSTTTPGQGIPRTFTAFEGFGIALAATMLESGLTRKIVTACFAKASEQSTDSKRTTNAPVYQLYDADSGRIEIGDGKYVRFRAEKRLGVAKGVDTEWVPLFGNVATPEPFRPTVLVTIETEPLALLLRAEQRKL